MPENDYDFNDSEDQRTFAVQAYHMALFIFKRHLQMVKIPFGVR